MSFKRLKAKHTLVIGCIHLGFSSSVLRLLSKIAKHYDAEVIHAGGLVSRVEMNMYRNRMFKLRTWEDLDHDVSDTTYHKTCEEINLLIEEQKKRYETVLKYFDNCKFVTNDDSFLCDELDLSYYDNYRHIKESLGVSAIMANGEKIANQPITNRIIKAMQKWGSSHILPHPIQSTKLVASGKLGQPNWLISTGSLCFPQKIQRVSDIYKIHAQPGAVLVAHHDKLSQAHIHRIKLEGNFKSTTCQTVIDNTIFHSDNKNRSVSNANKAMVITDAHAPYQHEPTVNLFAHTLADYKPDTLIDMGDIADFDSVSRHTKNTPGLNEGKRLKTDLDSMQSITNDYVSDYKPKLKVLIDSNHQNWLSNFINDNPNLRGLLDWKTISKTYLKGWKVLQDTNDIFTFGDLTIRHGHQENIRKAKLMFNKYICGHWHTHEEEATSYKIGCACHLKPVYLGGNITNWLHQFVLLAKVNNSTSLSIKTVLKDGKKFYTWFNGEFIIK